MHKQLVTVVTLYLASTLTVQASGSGPVDIFISRSESDVKQRQYYSGELGILLSSYSSAELYLAWRTIILGKDTILKANQTLLEHLPEQRNAIPAGWILAQGDGSGSIGWTNASQTYATPNRAPIRHGTRTSNNVYTSYEICSPHAFAFAEATLQHIKKRADATPERLKTWVEGQDAVFAFCDYDPVVKRDGKPIPAPPAPLPNTEATYWQQLRGYQIASAYFYNEQFDESTRLFTAIGKQPEHPMYLWGDYLTLRSHIRETDLDRHPDVQRQALQNQLQQTEQLMFSDSANAEKYNLQLQTLRDEIKRQQTIWLQNRLAEINAEAQNILNQPHLSAIHNAARASLRIAQARFAPELRYLELSHILNDVHQDPYLDDHLIDWELLSVTDHKKTGEKKYPFIDWISSLHDCSANRLDTYQLDKNIVYACQTASQHAIERWKTTSQAQLPDSHAWLTAALMTTSSIPAELEAAALAVPNNAPEYLTVQYNLARLYRYNDQADKARAILDVLIKQNNVSKVSISSQNLLLQERFSLATSVRDASAYLQRIPFTREDIDTGETATTAMDKPQLAEDGLRWLNYHSSSADLLQVAQDQRLHADIRAKIAVATWIRADLLQQADIAKQAAKLIANTIPILKTAALRYLQPQTAEKRRHGFVITMLEHQLQLDISHNSDYLERNSKDWPNRTDATASMWCSFPEEETPSTPWKASIPNTSDKQVLKNEMSELKKIKTATGFTGDHVLSWAQLHPHDPDIPWLLHITVRSTKGGCLDRDSSKLSRTAHKILHSKYKDSPWAVATPYWY